MNITCGGRKRWEMDKDYPPIWIGSRRKKLRTMDYLDFDFVFFKWIFTIWIDFMELK